MHGLLVASLFFIFLGIMDNYIAVTAFDIQSIEDDLKEFNISCTDDNCLHNEKDSLSSRACNCGAHCVRFGTCCLDSSYVGVAKREEKLACRNVYKGNTYFMVDYCSLYDNVWASLCNDESSGDDDIQNILPVTSLVTFTTYKNYYCFQCHEESDDFMYWQLKVQSRFALNQNSKDESKELNSAISFIYNKKSDAVMASYGDNSTENFSLSASLEIPHEIANLTHVCEPQVISDCPDEWSDDQVRNKCHLYTAIKRVVKIGASTVYYKNIHCALCNNESLNHVYCKTRKRGSYGGHGHGYGGHRRKPGSRFTFTYLLDINRSDGELVGMIQKCSEDHIWDRFSKKCRKLTCALPGFKIRDRKCVQE